MGRIEKLEQLIRHHKILYYRGTPEISDKEFDNLEDELRKLDPTNPVLEIIGSQELPDKKIKHAHKMLSLDKTYKENDLLDWVGKHDVVSTFKLDGVACSLIFENNKLSLAKTRGDGTYGEDISHKILWIENIPKKVSKGLSKNFEVRGELYCTEKNFFHLSEEMVSQGLEKPTSQRNIVAGLMGRKENLELCRFINFQAFDFIIEGKKLKKEMEKYQILKEFGFEIPEVELHKDSKSIEAAIEKAKIFMSEGDYGIDGLVFTINDLETQDQMGVTSHHPRYKIAFKFQSQSAKTKIKEIIWSVSRNGILTPVGIIEPVELSGAKISRVTFHNYGLVKQYELKFDDEIEIIRSGEVIPKFIALIKSSKHKFEIPTRCPSCESKVKIEDIRLYCSNPDCPGKNKEIILNFIQKIGIEDLSSKRLDELMSAKLVKNIPDLYRLKKEDLLRLDKVQDVLATKLIKTIEASKKVDLITFLSALGISGGAYNKCEKVVHNGFNTIDKIKKITPEKLMEIESFAEKSSVEFYNSLKEKFPLIDKLGDLGFKFEKVKEVHTPISGKKICITGALTEKRSVVEGKIREFGGIVVTSVSENTDYLLTNEKGSDSSKFVKAKKLKTPIITEEEFFKLIS